MRVNYYKIQRGRGLGGFLKNIFRFVAPVVKKVVTSNTAKKIGKEIVKRGLKSAKDVIKGEPVKNVVVREKKYLKKKADGVIDKVSKKIQEKNKNKNNTKEEKSHLKLKRKKNIEQL